MKDERGRPVPTSAARNLLPTLIRRGFFRPIRVLVDPRALCVKRARLAPPLLRGLSGSAERRESDEQVFQESLRVGDGCFNLALRDIDDVTVIKAIAEPVNVIQSTPLLCRPIERMGQALKHCGPMTLRASETVAGGFEGNASEPEGSAMSRSESRSKCPSWAQRRAARVLRPL